MKFFFAFWLSIGLGLTLVSSYFAFGWQALLSVSTAMVICCCIGIYFMWLASEDNNEKSEQEEESE